MKVCPSCHAEAVNEKMFCGQCGTRLVAQVVPQVSAPVQGEAVVQEKEQLPRQEPALQPVVVVAKAEQASEQSPRKMTSVFVVVLGVVVVALVAVAFWFRARPHSTAGAIMAHNSGPEATWTFVSGRTASVEIDGGVSIAIPGAVRLSPGPHRLRFTAPGYAEVIHDTEVASGDSTIDVRLVPELTGRWRRVDSDGSGTSEIWSLKQRGPQVMGHIEQTAGGDRETLDGSLGLDGVLHLANTLWSTEEGIPNGSYTGTVSDDGSKIEGSFEVTAHVFGEWGMVRVDGSTVLLRPAISPESRAEPATPAVAPNPQEGNYTGASASGDDDWSEQELSISARNPGGVSSRPLALGVQYELVVSGTYDAWGRANHAVDALECFQVPPCNDRRKGKLFQGLRVDGVGLWNLSGETLTYNSDHVYVVSVAGHGRPLKFVIQDAVTSAADNVGEILVRITRK